MIMMGKSIRQIWVNNIHEKVSSCSNEPIIETNKILMCLNESGISNFICFISFMCKLTAERFIAILNGV